MDIFASPDGGFHDFYDRKTKQTSRNVATFTLGAAMARAGPGCTVHLANGVYRYPVHIGVEASKEKPLKIVGQFRTLIDPGLPPTPPHRGHMTPDEDDFAFFKLLHASHIHFQFLSFTNCWPAFAFVRDCQDILFEDINGIGSQFVVFARTGRHEANDRPTRGFTLRRVHWSQDPAGDMAAGRVRWSDVKTFASHAYYNGALFGSWDIAGDVEIDDCKIYDAFNVVRMDCRRDNAGFVNANVNIHDNVFRRIRDNAIEPESRALNWWVYRNFFENCHAPFSIHNLTGGWFYIFANELWFDAKVPGDDHTGGKVFKFKKSKEQPEFPWYTFHNSAVIRTPYAKKGETRNWTHRNNAIEFNTDPALGDRDVGFFSLQTDSKTHLKWHTSYNFAGDLSNHSQYRDGFPKEWGIDANGTHTPTVFAQKSRGGLILAGEPDNWKTAEPFKVSLPNVKTKLKLSTDAVVGARTRDGKLYGDGQLKFCAIEPGFVCH